MHRRFVGPTLCLQPTSSALRDALHVCKQTISSRPEIIQPITREPKQRLRLQKVYRTGPSSNRHHLTHISTTTLNKTSPLHSHLQPSRKGLRTNHLPPTICRLPYHQKQAAGTSRQDSVAFGQRVRAVIWFCSTELRARERSVIGWNLR